MSSADDVRRISTPWPPSFRADAKGVGAYAVREVRAPAAATRAWLRRLDLQPPHYRLLWGVRHVKGPWPLIGDGTVVGFALGPLLVPPVRVVDLAPDETGEPRGVAWLGGGPGVSVCHAFTVEAIDDETSLLRSEERFVGPVARLIAPVLRPGLQRVQTSWATAIAELAGRQPMGPPPVPSPGPGKVPANG